VAWCSKGARRATIKAISARNDQRIVRTRLAGEASSVLTVLPSLMRPFKKCTTTDLPALGTEDGNQTVEVPFVMDKININILTSLWISLT